MFLTTISVLCQLSIFKMSNIMCVKQVNSCAIEQIQTEYEYSLDNERDLANIYDNCMCDAGILQACEIYSLSK